MPSKTNRNAARRNNSPRIYSAAVQPDPDGVDSTFLSPPHLLQPLDDPPGHGSQRYDFGDDVERDGVGGLIQFDGDDLSGAVAKEREELSAPSPLALEPPSQLAVAREEAPLVQGSEVGHRRAPVMARSPTMLESFSRAVRNYVPSSIPVPSAAPSPPRVSRPVSFGSFMSSPRADPYRNSTGDPVILDSGDEEQGVTTYPGLKAEEDVVWAGWDVLPVEKPRQVLLLGYRSGLQIWDCTSLASVTEILNIHDARVGRVVYAGVLPPPVRGDDDAFAGVRPLVGIVSLNGGESDCLVYSLYSQHVVKRLALPGAVSFSATSKFIAVATTAPPEIHILSPHTFVTLFTIPSPALTSLVVPNIYSPPSDPKIVLPHDIEQSDNEYSSLISRPRPVLALSQRLLAFACAPPPAEPSGLSSADRASLPFGISQADLGNAAVKMGGSVLSGVKSLGGLAYTAARARLTGTPEERGVKAEAPTSPVVAGITNMFFSKSAPAASGGHARSESQSSGVLSGSIFNAKPTCTPDGGSTSSSKKGHYVTVLDLAPLLTSRAPDLVSRFVATKDQPVSGISFSRDGTSVVVAPKDGQVTKVFALKPGAKSARRAYEPCRSSDGEADADAEGAPWHVYDLRRGRTSAVVEGTECAHDGRWVAVGTRKRTVHVFAVNPYGGKTDVRSHLDGRVKNSAELQPLSTSVTPIIRLRFKPRQSRLAVPIAFTFIQSSEFMIPANLLPAPTSYPGSPKSLSAQSSPAGVVIKPVSPTPVFHRPTNFQDLLVFDPDDGVLSLRRFTLEESSGEQGLAIAGSIPIVGGVSVSLPVGSPASRMGTGVSPSNRSDHSSPRSSGLTQLMERAGEMVAKDVVVATWGLRRSRDWPEVRHRLRVSGSRPASETRRKDWLAHAELSTCSRSKRLVPRAIYLSHQFTFYALGEDYHALVRRHQFDVPVTKIEVRREVQASAYSTGLGESFVQGATAAIDVRAAPSSFDEPLASAISADLEYHNPSPPVIPMYPNGTPASHSSVMKAIPIRSVASGISDGMNEGLGRIRREFGRVRSPKMSARVDHSMIAPVPLEFDEEDDDFLLPGHTNEAGDPISRSGSGASVSISTPSTHEPLLEGGGEVEMWDAEAGWTQEDRQAIDDAERFDDLVVGFMDEEQVKPERPAVPAGASGKGKRKSKRRV